MNAEDLTLLPEGDGFLLVEFGADSTPGRRNARPAPVAALKAQSQSAQPRICTSRRSAKRVWHIRESGLGATAFVPGEPQHWEGWEDAAVAPENSAPICATSAPHGRVRLHGAVRPLRPGLRPHAPQLRSRNDRRALPNSASSSTTPPNRPRLRRLSLRRTRRRPGPRRLLPKMFGPELMEAFREFKTHLGPRLEDEPRQAHRRPTSPTKISASAPTTTPGNPRLTSRSPQDNGAYPRHSPLRRRRHAAAKTPATMCPSYMATREEKHSTRGRAHLLWEMMQRRSRSPTTGKTSRSRNPSTSASPAKPAKPSAPSTSTWPPTKPSSSPTTTKAA